MNAVKHPAADRYLRRLNRALAGLPRARREEIVDEIREHIEEAAPTGAGDAEVRNVLDDLGDPETIAADARERFGVNQPKAGVLEGIAIALLLVGGIVIPALGWIVGAVLLWTSRIWDVRDKLVGTLLVPGGLAFPLFVFPMLSLGFSSCETTPGRAGGGEVGITMCTEQPLTSEWWGVVVMVLVFLVPIASAIYLGRRAFRDAA